MPLQRGRSLRCFLLLPSLSPTTLPHTSSFPLVRVLSAPSPPAGSLRGVNDGCPCVKVCVSVYVCDRVCPLPRLATRPAPLLRFHPSRPVRGSSVLLLIEDSSGGRGWERPCPRACEHGGPSIVRGVQHGTLPALGTALLGAGQELGDEMLREHRREPKGRLRGRLCPSRRQSVGHHLKRDLRGIENGVGGVPRAASIPSFWLRRRSAAPWPRGPARSPSPLRARAP